MQTGAVQVESHADLSQCLFCFKVKFLPFSRLCCKTTTTSGCDCITRHDITSIRRLVHKLCTGTRPVVTPTHTVQWAGGAVVDTEIQSRGIDKKSKRNESGLYPGTKTIRMRKQDFCLPEGSKFYYILCMNLIF